MQEQQIIHQIFWTFVSFITFYGLLTKYVLKDLSKIYVKRRQFVEKTTEQIEGINKKAQVLYDMADKIIQEEIPQKQKVYIGKKLEPIIHDLELILLHEKEILKTKLEQYKIRRFSAQIENDEQLMRALNANAKMFLEKIK